MYLRHFSREQLFVCDYGELVASPGVLQDICDFLGVDSLPIERMPVVNAGSSDWTTCVGNRAEARARFVYDELMNILGTRTGQHTARSPAVLDGSEIPVLDVEVRAARRLLSRRHRDSGRAGHRAA